MGRRKIKEPKKKDFPGEASSPRSATRPLGSSPPFFLLPLSSRKARRVARGIFPSYEGALSFLFIAEACGGRIRGGGGVSRATRGARSRCSHLFRLFFFFFFFFFFSPVEVEEEREREKEQIPASLYLDRLP